MPPLRQIVLCCGATSSAVPVESHLLPRQAGVLGTHRCITHKQANQRKTGWLTDSPRRPKRNFGGAPKGQGGGAWPEHNNAGEIYGERNRLSRQLSQASGGTKRTAAAGRARRERSGTARKAGQPRQRGGAAGLRGGGAAFRACMAAPL